MIKHPQCQSSQEQLDRKTTRREGNVDILLKHNNVEVEE
jgi:hypothetical protein